MAAEMGALAMSRARAGSFDKDAAIDPSMLDEYQALWDLLETDENGLVEITAAASEVETILTEQSEYTEPPAGVSVRRLLGAVDLDGDDAISFGEFCLVMSQPLSRKAKRSLTALTNTRQIPGLQRKRRNLQSQGKESVQTDPKADTHGKLVVMLLNERRHPAIGKDACRRRRSP